MSRIPRLLPRWSKRCLIGVCVGAMAAVSANEAAAQNIKTPNGHTDYRAEVEPHFALAIFRRGLIAFDGHKKDPYFGVPGVGGGLRASIEVADPAFIPKLNNTIAISFGMDVTTCDVCHNDAVLYFPVALQWNFFFSKEWSAYGEVGPMIRADLGDQVLPDLYVAAGGRYQFNDTVALTARLGYPFFTFGVSFFIPDAK
ncbi:MAG: hypothetical protein HOW73_15605 [Polyangiaceae bacterium]|nr:hypothetical protein [Polyangiaceae bacterium]